MVGVVQARQDIERLLDGMDGDARPSALFFFSLAGPTASAAGASARRARQPSTKGFGRPPPLTHPQRLQRLAIGMLRPTARRSPSACSDDVRRRAWLCSVFCGPIRFTRSADARRQRRPKTSRGTGRSPKIASDHAPTIASIGPNNRRSDSINRTQK